MVNYDLERGITVFTSSGGSGQEEGPEKTKSQFIIAEAMPADSGNYTCKPSNAVAASIQVFVSNTRGIVKFLLIIHIYHKCILYFQILFFFQSTKLRLFINKVLCRSHLHRQQQRPLLSKYMYYGLSF